VRIVSLGLLLAGCTHREPGPVPATDPLDAPLPSDPGVRSGRFDNGLTWYVEPNSRPQARAFLRLVVDAGSVLEDDDQRGLAHVVEHMAFNGTTHFPGNTVVEVLEAGGSRFGPHLNAHTGFDETVYELMVPTDDPAALDQAFLVLEDWASGIVFDRDEIERERGVVLEEWRTRLGAAGRVFEETVPLLFHGSPYADRVPIGTKESLETFAPEAVERFYRDWYTPDRMAVIAVGDFDPRTVEQLVAAHFADLPEPADPRARIRPSIPAHAETLTAIIADPELPSATVEILAKHDDVEIGTARAYRKALVEQLGFAIVNERLADLARRADPPFLAASAGEQRLTPTEGGSVLSAAVEEDGIERGYRTLLQEVRRARDHGFLPDEIERARVRMLDRFDRALLERDTTDSSLHASEIVRAFTTGESMPGIDAEVAMVRQFAPEIDAAALQAWARAWMPDVSRVVTVTMPDKPGIDVPTAEGLAAIAAEVAATAVAAPTAAGAVGPLVADTPAPGSVVAVHTELRDGLGTTGWTLSNGAEVWFKPTDFRADEIRLFAFSPGGTSLVDEEAYVPTATMIDVAHWSGLGPHDAGALERWLAGRSASLGLQLTETRELVSGTSSVGDLETLLQLVHASFADPRLTEDGFRSAQDHLLAAVANRDADPFTAFQDAWDDLVWPDDLRAGPWTTERLTQMDLAATRAAYARHFGNAGDFTFVFAGALPSDFESLVTTWIGSLPGTRDAGDRWVDRGVRPARGALETTVRRGVDAQAAVRIEWHGPFDDDTWDTRSRLYALEDTLEEQLRDELRENRGGVYGVHVDASEMWEPTRWYRVRVSFTCDPARVDELVDATQDVVAELRDEGPPAVVVRDLKEQNRRERQVDLRENGFWVSAVAGALQRGEDPRGILGWDARNDALDPTVVRDAARAWLDADDTVVVVLLPEPVGSGMQHLAPADR
jgi:zinc protease